MLLIETFGFGPKNEEADKLLQTHSKVYIEIVDNQIYIRPIGSKEIQLVAKPSYKEDSPEDNALISILRPYYPLVALVYARTDKVIALTIDSEWTKAKYVNNEAAPFYSRMAALGMVLET